MSALVELLSQRLRLLAPDDLRALLEGRPVEGLTWAEGYPLDGSVVAAAMMEELVDRGVPIGPFGQFQILTREDALVIGDIGFHAPPDELGEVTLGFDVIPARRNRGIATEALRTMLAWALGRPEVRAVHAEADAVNVASQRVLSRAGMAHVADEGDRKVFEIAA